MIHPPGVQLTIDQLKGKIADRQLYIWGAGNQGRGIASVLREQNIPVAGFIDSSPSLIGKSFAGIMTYAPSQVETVTHNEIFIIIAVFFHGREIEKKCVEMGLQESVHFVHYYHLKPRDYAIDVSGLCNLRCIACPRGTKRHVDTGGFMSPAVFEQVIDKIKKEDPFVGNIQLYQWGEPTLNKDLPEMISYAQSKGINCAISSNLNTKADFTKIIKAKPEWLRLSASGWAEEYEITHTGGNWQLFLTQLKSIAKGRKAYHPQMKIELFYHLYQHSTGKSFRMIEALCEELDIEFHPVYAYLISLDDVLAYLEGTPLPESAERAKESMLLRLEQGLEIAQKERDLPCDAIRSIHINPDLSVSNCMMYYYPEQNRSVSNFLTSSLADIMEARMSCSLCKRCMRQAMHRYCSAFSTFKPDCKALCQ